MPSRERAERLLRKAAQDKFVLSKLVSDPASPDELIGFHAQQAIEKMLKAVSTLATEKGEAALPENETVTPEEIVEIRKGLKTNQVREGVF